MTHNLQFRSDGSLGIALTTSRARDTVSEERHMSGDIATPDESRPRGEDAISQDELARLQQRVIDLEYIVAEYQAQTASILRSASWRLTSPLRGSTRLLRTVQYKARGARARARSRRQPNPVVLDGLLPSPVTSIKSGIAPAGVREADGLPGDTPLSRVDAKVVVLAHVHYPELWPDISDRFARIPMKFDLVVTVTRGAAESAIPTIKRHHPDAQILVVPNRGRDWGPTLDAVRAGLVSGYDAVAKVHTKKSEHRIDGTGWRLELLDGIFTSPVHVQRIVDLLRTDPGIGAIAPHRHIAGTESWGSDLAIVSMLAESLPMPVSSEDLRFPAGSMFWCRPWLLERLTDFGVRAEDFEAEGGQLDGTVAHAFERMIGVLCRAAGTDVIDSAMVGKRLGLHPARSQRRKCCPSTTRSSIRRSRTTASGEPASPTGRTCGKRSRCSKATVSPPCRTPRSVSTISATRTR